jgi:hypothetical protein
MPPKNELPTEAPTPTPDAMPSDMAAPDMAPPTGGQVMVQMPADAFDAIHTLVTQLASGLDSLKAEVEKQKGGAPAPEAAPASPAEQAGAPTSADEEEFLKSIAEQGSMR